MTEQQTHIDIALAEPINRLRLRACALAKKLPEQSERAALAAELTDDIRNTMRASGIAADSKEAIAFEEEVKKANGWLKHLADPEDKSFPGIPNPGTPFEKLLWSNVIMLGTFESPMKEGDGFEARADAQEKSGFSETKNGRIKNLYEQLAHSRPMQHMLAHFCLNTDTSKRGVPPETNVQYGVPGSWFFCRRNTHIDEAGNMHEVGAPLVNLDLYFSLVLGNYVETVFEHEMEHAEKTKGMPSFLEEFFVRKVKASEALRKDPVDLRTDAPNDPMNAQKEALIREKLLSEYAYTLAHSFYNSAEDNMCNQGVIDLSDPDLHHPPYPGDMSYGLSVIHTLLGAGESWEHGLSEREENNAAQRFREIGHAVNEAFFMRNAGVAFTEENSARMNVLLETLVDAQTGATGLDAFKEMEPLCEDIARTQPYPGERKFKGYTNVAKTFANERNAKIQALFERFGKVEFEKALEEFQNMNLEEQIEQLKSEIQKLKDQIRQGAGTDQMPGQPGGDQPGQGEGQPAPGEGGEPGQGGAPGQGGGKDGGVDATIDGIPIKLPEAPDGCSQGGGNGQQPGGGGGIGKPQRWGEQVAKAAEIAKANTKANSEKGGKVSARKGGYGLGSEGTAQLSLGDGRTFDELRTDPLYLEARAKMVNEFIEIARKFQHDSVGRGGNFQLISDRSPAQDLNIGRAVNAGIAMGANSIDEDKYYLFDSIASSPEATPGEIWLNVDFSGSMGIGVGSDLEIAFKSSAMVWDAAQEAAKLEPNLGKFRVHLMAWGNTTPSKITSPDMDENEALSRIDDVLHKVFNNEHIEGLHGGTDADGALNAIMSDLAHLSEDELHEFLPDSPIGWLGGLFLSDGDVGLGHSLNNTQELLNMMPNMTLDAGITESRYGRNHATALEKYIKDVSKRAMASSGEDINRGICFKLPTGETSGDSYPNLLMDWIKERSDQLRSKRAYTRAEVEAQAQEACNMLNKPRHSTESHLHNGTVNPAKSIHYGGYDD